MEDFQNAGLVLAGHGSTLNEDSSAPVFLHADRIRRRGVFGEVQECFWKLEPSFSSVRNQVFSARIFVVPLFISEGYFTQQVLPRELGFCQNDEKNWRRIRQWRGQRWHYCDPVGTHLSMTEVLTKRATEILNTHPFPTRPADHEVSLFIAGHGTGNHRRSRRIIEEQAKTLHNTGRYADVHAVFMEEDPRIAECYQLACAPNLVIVPFFISDGLHSFEDIPVMLGDPESAVAKRLQEGRAAWHNPTERQGKRVWYTRSIGMEPCMTEVILERAHEANAWKEDETI